MIKPYSQVSFQHSKGDVRRAGEKLRQCLAGSLSFEHAKDALTIAERWRQLHMYPLNTFQRMLRGKLQRVGIKGTLFSQRLKKMPTMINKLSRIDGGLDSMQDIAGIRIVFKSLTELRKFEKNLLKSRSQHKLKNQKDYILSPKDDGYRGVHLIYRCHSQAKNTPPIVQDLMIELQLRTQLQHYWATAVEAVDMFYAQSLKFGQGNQDWNHFFTLASAAFAHVHETASSNTPHAPSNATIIQQLRTACEHLNAIQKLEAISRLTNELKPEDRKSTKTCFYLLMLARDERSDALSFKYMKFANDEEEEANRWYKTLEEGKEDSLWKNLDVVLVRTTGQQLAKLYSNYFLDVTEFLKALKKILTH